MRMYNLIEHSANYDKTGSLWQYCKVYPNNNMTDSESFKFKSRLTNNTNNVGIANVETAVPFKPWSNFCRTLAMGLISCEVYLKITWSANCVIYQADRATTFAITDTKLYVPVVTPSTWNQDPKKKICCNKYHSRVSTQAWNQYLDYLIDRSFQGLHRLFVLLFEDNAVRTGHA